MGSTILLVVRHPGESSSMTLFVMNLAGRTITLNDVMPSDKILSLKVKVKERENIPTDEQVLIWGGKQLDDEKTIEGYGILKNSTLHLVIRLCGSN